MKKQAMTDAFLRGLKLPAGETQFDVGDAIVPGLSIRVTARSKTWTVRLGDGRKVLGTYPEMTISKARQAAEHERTAAGTSTPKTHTMGSLAPVFVKEYLPELAQTTQKEWTRMLLGASSIIPTIAHVNPANVEKARAEIAQALAEVKVRSGYSANRTFEVLRRMVSWGIGQNYLPHQAAGLFAYYEKPMKREKRRTRFLTIPEIRAVWGALKELSWTASLFFRLSFRSGQRRGEVLRAAWPEFDLDDEQTWSFMVKGNRSEPDKEVWLGLPKQLIEELKLAKATMNGSKWVCASRSKSGHRVGVQKAMEKLRKVSGVDFRPHDIRRTVATMMGKMEIDRDDVSLVLSHRPAKGEPITNKVYNLATYVKPTRRALQAWNDRLDEIVSA